MTSTPRKKKAAVLSSEPSYSYSPDRDGVKKNVAGRKIKVAIYKRISALTAESVTFERQHAEVIKNLKDSYGIDIESGDVEYVIFEEEGSAFKNKRRPEFDKMINAIKRGEFTHLATYAIDRLFRNTNVSGVVTPILEQSGIIICIKSLGTAIDLGSLAGKMQWSMFAIIAEASSVDTQDRTLGSHKIRSNYGIGRGGRVPFGMTAEKQLRADIGGERTVYKIDDEPQSTLPNGMSKAGVVREMYRRAANGTGSLGICKWLNTNNIPTPDNGTGWYPHAVKRILTCPIYMGVSRHKGELLTGDDGKYVQTHDVLIDPVEWEKVQSLVDSRVLKNRLTHRASQLSGLLECGDCGHTMRASTSKIRGEHYGQFRCARKYEGHDCAGNNIGRDGVELTMFKITKAILDNPALRSKFITPVDIQANPEDTKVEAELKAAIAKYEKRLAAEDDEEMIAAIQTSIDTRREELARMAARYNSLSTYVKNATNTNGEAFELAWNADDKMNVQLMLQAIYKSVEIDKTNNRMNRHTLAKHGWDMDMTRLTLKFHNGLVLKYDDLVALSVTAGEAAA